MGMGSELGVRAEALPAEGGAGSAAKGREKKEDRHRLSTGLEAARERARLREAEPMLMVCDVMTMLSRVPWSTKGADDARRTRQQLSELKSLMAAEKALAEERRFGSRKVNPSSVAHPPPPLTHFHTSYRQIIIYLMCVQLDLLGSHLPV